LDALSVTLIPLEHWQFLPCSGMLVWARRGLHAKWMQRSEVAEATFRDR
jgi:hypothetical protein